ncbi:MAG: hypothetical protein NZ703_08135, partial [Gemmataceae bacterium]|nr:hypothetical protein [Gemmataceae bacterium]
MVRGVRHPWPSVLFVGLLLLAYEGGLAWWAQHRGEAPPRCGVEQWLRYGCVAAGVAFVCPVLPLVVISPLVLAAVLAWPRRPASVGAALLGIIGESLCAALVLWIVSRNFGWLCERC